jgi:secreted PhoX family phosphatase
MDELLKKLQAWIIVETDPQKRRILECCVMAIEGQQKIMRETSEMIRRLTG